MPRLLAPIFLLILTLAAPLATTTAFAEDAKLQRTISISGHGELSVIPDLADINMGVSTSARKAGDALAANTAAMRDLFALLKTLGIEDKDIATSNFSVNPRLDYGKEGNQPPKVVGYDVSNTVNVRLRKVDMLGDLLDKAVGDGTNTINGLTFSVSEMDKKLDEARKDALADARRKAEIYAAAGGVSIGQLLSVSEGSNNDTPRPYAYKRKAIAASADAVPIAQGEQQISIDVNVVWEIK